MKPGSCFSFLFLSLLLLAACAPIFPATQVPPLVVHYSFAAQSFLESMQECAGETIVVPERRAVDFQDLGSADLLLRVGKMTGEGIAYKIGTVELLVVVHAGNNVERLDESQVLGLFTGSIRNWQDVGGKYAPVQVWVYPSGEDIQQLFQDGFLGGTPISTYAMLASDLESMRDAIAADENAIGILTRQWISGEVKDILPVGEAPALVILLEDSPPAIQEIAGCLQK